MTRAALERQARERWAEVVAEADVQTADDAAAQCGLPAVFVWTNLTGLQLFRLAVALRIRLCEVRP